MSRMKLDLSAKAQPRSELVASWEYGHVASDSEETLAAAPPVDGEAAEPEEPEEESADSSDVDADVTQGIDAAKQAVAATIGRQSEDQDKDADDSAVSKALQRAADALTEAATAQEKDNGETVEPEEPGEEAEPEGEEESKLSSNPPGEPESSAKCEKCEHLASQHENEEGKNGIGGCKAEGCSCEAFAASEKPPASGEAVEHHSLAEAEPDEEIPGADEDAAPAPDDSGKTKPPPVEGSDLMGPAFTIPIAVIEGEPTGDGRAIAEEALDWREPPLPLMGLATGTHDPTGMSTNDPAVICGRIDSIERVPGPNAGTSVLCLKGYFLPNDEGTYFAELAESFGRIGVSADIAVDESEQEITEVDADGFPMAIEETLTKGTFMGCTIVPTPAFEGAYLVLGDGEEQPEAIPQSEEDEGARTAAGIHWMSYEECEPCLNDTDILTAAGGPTAPPADWFANPAFTEGDGRLVEILDRRNSRVIGGKYACPITVTEDGRVFGHIAPWGVCHTAFPNSCVVAPHSKVDYAHFKRAQHVVTAEGEKIRVGVITMDTGHASTRGITAAQAMAHYDNTALAVADVNVGEDEYGIWIAGALRPEATDEDVRTLRAASISGDWRNMGSGLELVAALAVNQPGYPLAQVASGHQEAMVASGVNVMHRLKSPADADGNEESVLTHALMPLLEDARGRATSRLAERSRAKANGRLARYRSTRKD